MATALATAASTSFHFRDVALDEDRVGSQVLHHLEGLVAALLDYVGQRQFRPLTREDARGRLPDTRTGTGNQRHFAVQYSRHVKSSSVDCVRIEHTDASLSAGMQSGTRASSKSLKRHRGCDT